MTYEDLDKKYQRLSHENTIRARKVDTLWAYEKAKNREKLIQKAFFNDCKRHLVNIK